MQHLTKHGSYLLRARRLDDIAKVLFTNKAKLHALIAKPVYHVFTIAKKKGGVRQICAPNKALMKVQKRMNSLLQEVYKEEEDVHGFISSLNKNWEHHPCANAGMHLCKNYVWNIDLKDFFPSILTQRIKEVFEQEPFFFNERLSAYIALLFCYKRQLPAGAPSSPMLSNFVCINMDQQIRLWVQSLNMEHAYDITYSRYVDDLTLSYNKQLTPIHKEAFLSIILSNGFEPNVRKLREQNKYQAQWVTGIKVNTKPNLDRRYIRKLRAILHHLQTQGIAKATCRYFQLPFLTTRLLIPACGICTRTPFNTLSLSLKHLFKKLLSLKRFCIT